MIGLVFFVKIYANAWIPAILLSHASECELASSSRSWGENREFRRHCNSFGIRIASIRFTSRLAIRTRQTVCPNCLGGLPSLESTVHQGLGIWSPEPNYVPPPPPYPILATNNFSGRGGVYSLKLPVAGTWYAPPILVYAPPPLEGYFHLAYCVPRIFSTLFLQYFVIFAKVIFGTPILIGFWDIFGDFGDFW